MKTVVRFVATLITCVIMTACASAQHGCTYSPEFTDLRSTLAMLSTLEAAKKLQAFAAKNKNPSNCEAMAIDQALGEQERLLVKLATKGGNESPAHVVFRCNVFNPKTAQCQSPLEDGTAHPNLDGKTMAPLSIEKSGAFEIVSQLPDARLHAVYITPLGHALDGKPAKPLDIQRGVK
jgi:hypothetical protein